MRWNGAGVWGHTSVRNRAGITVWHSGHGTSWARCSTGLGVVAIHSVLSLVVSSHNFSQTFHQHPTAPQSPLLPSSVRFRYVWRKLRQSSNTITQIAHSNKLHVVVSLLRQNSSKQGVIPKLRTKISSPELHALPSAGQT